MRVLAPLLLCLLAACGQPTVDAPGLAAHAAPTPAERIAAALAHLRSPAGEPAADDDPLMAEALSRLARRDYAGARIALERVVAARPEAARAQFLIGYTHHKEKRYAEALPWIERALDLGPRFERGQAAFYVYGWCLWYLGQPEGARVAFEAYLELEPHERDAHFALGLIAVDEGRYEAAEQHLRRSIDLVEELRAARPGDRQLARDLAKALNALADVALAREELELAREHLERCVALHPDAYEAWFKLSRVLTRSGDEARAAEARRHHDLARQRLGR